jgi:glycopeptide antibiotics resistance protein
MPNLILQGQSGEESINLIPLVSLTLQELKTSLLNILLFIPFGFGLPFITNFQMKHVVIFGAFVSITFEILQLVTGLLSKITFRITDVNDVIFNTLGAVIGYILFMGFIHICRKRFHRSKNKILQYITERSGK